MSSLSYIKIFFDASETVDLLSDASAGRLLKALLHYGAGQQDELTGPERLVYSMLRSQIDRDAAEYNAMCERQKANGSKGGRPSKKPQKPSGFSENPENPVVFQKTQKTQEEEEEEEEEDNTLPPYGGKSNARAGARETPPPPKLGEILEYISSEHLRVDGRRFFAYYQAGGWRFAGEPMKDWRAALQYWHTTQREDAPPADNNAARSYDLERAMVEMATTVPELKKKGAKKNAE